MFPLLQDPLFDEFPPAIPEVPRTSGVSGIAGLSERDFGSFGERMSSKGKGCKAGVHCAMRHFITSRAAL